MEIGPGIRRLGGGLVNSYLVEAAGEVTIVDAGAPSYWGDLPRELAVMGRSLDDVRAVVLTHGHSDHIGFAERYVANAGPRSSSTSWMRRSPADEVRTRPWFGPVRIGHSRVPRRLGTHGLLGSRGSARSRRTATAPRSTAGTPLILVPGHRR